MKKSIQLTPLCPYCGKFSAKVTGKKVYPHRKDLYGKTFYLCEPCNAYVGCHPNTDKPLGRLADEQLRTEKKKAHSAFDPIWRKGFMKRVEAYAWLSETLGIPKSETHIGMFDVDMCKKVQHEAGKKLAFLLEKQNETI
ncbi:zinc-finger-containing protein [Testudinibacter sp. P80/BLE/0925]